MYIASLEVRLELLENLPSQGKNIASVGVHLPSLKRDRPSVRGRLVVQSVVGRSPPALGGIQFAFIEVHLGPRLEIAEDVFHEVLQEIKVLFLEKCRERLKLHLVGTIEVQLPNAFATREGRPSEAELHEAHLHHQGIFSD